MTIQNESKKIAVTSAQMTSIKEAYLTYLKSIKPEQVTNEALVGDILSAPVSSPEQDVLITDAPKEETPVVDTTNIFEQNLVVDAPKEEASPVTEPKVEEPVAPVVTAEESPKLPEQPTSPALDNVDLKKLLDDFYDLQIHVQEFSIELEETLERIKKNLNVETKVTTPAAQAPVVEQPAIEQVVTPQNNEVINSFNPNDNFTGNIFDMPPMDNASTLKL